MAETLSPSVLVTGSCGLVGRAVVERLEVAGYRVRGFDRLDGQDVLDKSAVSSAVDGSDAVVHLAALFDPRPGERSSPAERAIPGLTAAQAVAEVNAIGGQHVMEACLVWGVRRLVITSSVNALGVFMAQSPPDYLPIDDLHPARPSSPYGLSKRAVERVAAAVSKEGGLTTVCLRPPAVLDDEMIAEVRARRRRNPSVEWTVWEYGAWLHVEDLAEAVLAALRCPDPPGGSAVMLVCAGDVWSDDHPTLEQLRRMAPTVPWRGGPGYETDSWRSLVDDSRARVMLGWSPSHRWPRSAG